MPPHRSLFQFVTEFQTEIFREFVLDRHGYARVGRRAHPGAGDESIAFRQGLAPGEIQIAVQGVVVLRFFGDGLTYRLAVDGGETAAHHRVHRRAEDVFPLEERGEVHALFGKNVNGELIRRIVGQLRLPTFE